MADIAITPGSVVPGALARFDYGFAGEAITAGKAVYKASTGLWMLADSNSGISLARVATGIASNGASANQPITVQKSGLITIGAVLTPGVAYYLSDTPGGLCLVADVVTGEYSQVVGIATTAAILDLIFKASGVAL